MSGDWTESVEAEFEGSENDDFEFSGEGKTSDDIRGGNRIDKEGWYLLEAVDVKFDMRPVNDNGEEQFPNVTVTFSVISDDPKLSGPGSTIRQWMAVADKGGGPPPDWAVDKMFRLLLPAGVVVEKDGSIVDRQSGTTKIGKSTVSQVKGRYLCAEVLQEKAKTEKDREREAKFGPTFSVKGGYFYDPRDPAASKCAKNDELLLTAGYTGKAAFTWGDSHTGKEQDSTPVTADDL